MNQIMILFEQCIAIGPADEVVAENWGGGYSEGRRAEV